MSIYGRSSSYLRKVDEFKRTRCKDMAHEHEPKVRENPNRAIRVMLTPSDLEKLEAIAEANDTTATGFVQFLLNEILN